jgi:hypothetical protein
MIMACGRGAFLLSKRWRTATFLALASTWSVGAAQLGDAKNQPAAVVKQYCSGCHNNQTKSGNFSLETANPANPTAHPDVWEKVVRKLVAQEMPPAGLPRPSAQVQASLISSLVTDLDRAAAANPDPGRPTIHRLNRNEYSNAIRDLLALDIQPGASLPPDDTGYGFDNIADVLTLSPVLVERYMSVARTVASLAVGNTDVKPVVDTFDALREVRTGARGQRVGRNDRISEDLPFGSVGGLSFRYNFPVDAEYQFKIRMARPNAGFGETAPPVGQVLELRLPVKAGVRHVGLTFLRSDALAETLPGAGRGFGGQRRGAGPAVMNYLDLRLDGARLKLYDVAEGQRGRDIVDLLISGPYNITGPGDTLSRRKIFICRPASAREEEPCARDILSTLAHRAFRRPVTQADVTPLLAFFRTGRRDGGFERGIEMALRAMLVSPHFLFRVERDPMNANASSVHRLSDVELASRLSFFLWSSIPDEELLSLAEKSKLREPAALTRQVARMLEDPKSKAFVSNFAGQWLLLRNLEQVKPDVEQYPAFDESLRRAFRQETELLFNAVLRENRPVTDLLDAKFTFLNERLAEFYGVKGVYGSRFRRVEMKDGKRTGVLGHGSILTVTALPTRTSAVLRGKWVLESLLGSPPPPPPPDIPALEEGRRDRPLSQRQAMELHRTNPICASCHTRMDPIGFSLENFDGIGAWRDDDAGTAIDASGSLPDGTKFQGPSGLAQLLLTKHRDEFVATVAEKLVTYALGRGVESSDRPAIRAIVRKAGERNYTIGALIEAIVDSPQFTLRRTRG